MTTNNKNLYFLFIDLETTCFLDDDPIKPPNFVPEVIEFAMVITNKSEILFRKSIFVKPKINPILSEFCKSLTHISQRQIDLLGISFEEALDKIKQTIEKELRQRKKHFIVITWSKSDLRTILPIQFRISEIYDIPRCFTSFIDLQYEYKRFIQERFFYNPHSLNLLACIEESHLVFKGKLHRGIDDCINTARLFHHMVQQGWKPRRQFAAYFEENLIKDF